MHRPAVGAVVFVTGLLFAVAALWLVSREEHTTFMLPVLHGSDGEIVSQARPVRAPCGTALGRWLGDQPVVAELDVERTDVDVRSFNRELRARFDECRWGVTERARTAAAVAVAALFLGVGARLLPPPTTEPVPDPH